MEPDESVVSSRSRGCPHYLTLRLADALPHPVVEAWHRDLDRRIHRLRGLKGRALAPDEERTIVRRSLGRLERYLDGGRGACVLSDERAAGLVEEVLWSGDGTRYHLHAWSVMPNHLHALVTPLAGSTPEQIVADWKAETTQRVNQELRRSGGLWHPHVMDFEVAHPAELGQLRHDIATNPVQAGLHEWPFAGEESRASRERFWL